MTLDTIITYCTQVDVQRELSVYAVAKRLDDFCSNQQVRITGTPTAGSYTLIFNGVGTDPIAYNADQYAVQAAMRNVIGLDNTVVDTRGTAPNYIHRIKLVDVLGAATALTATNSMTGGSIAIQYVLSGSVQALDNSIIEATEELNKYLMPRYTQANLARSNWVNRVCALMATDFFASRRGLTVPESLEKRMERYWTELEGFIKGWYQIPGIPMRRALGPLYSNIRIIPWYSFRAQRVERSTSSQQPTTSARGQDRDWQDAFLGPIETY